MAVCIRSTNTTRVSIDSRPQYRYREIREGKDGEVVSMKINSDKIDRSIHRSCRQKGSITSCLYIYVNTSYPYPANQRGLVQALYIYKGTHLGWLIPRGLYTRLAQSHATLLGIYTAHTFLGFTRRHAFGHKHNFMYVSIIWCIGVP